MGCLSCRLYFPSAGTRCSFFCLIPGEFPAHPGIYGSKTNLFILVSSVYKETVLRYNPIFRTCPGPGGSVSFSSLILSPRTLGDLLLPLSPLPACPCLGPSSWMWPLPIFCLLPGLRCSSWSPWSHLLSGPGSNLSPWRDPFDPFVSTPVTSSSFRGPPL